MSEPRKLTIRTDDLSSVDKLSKYFSAEPKTFKEYVPTKTLLHAMSIYQDMPEFTQKRERPLAQFDIETDKSREELAQILEQSISDKTRSVWYPKQERGLGDWAWVSDSELKPNCEFFIISKRRPQCITARALKRMGLDFRIIVEPDDEAEYRKLWGSHVHVGDFDTTTKSSIPARNYVDDIAEGEKYWLVDDNIEDFNILNNNKKYVSRTGVMFRAWEDFCDRFKNVGQAGFNYYSFAKATDAVKPFQMNTRIYSCTLMNKNLKGVRVDGKLWRGRYNEDTDLSLRILKAGYCTLLSNQFLAGKVTTQRCKGGNTDSVYVDGDNRLKFAQSLREQHPDVVRVVKRFGRHHHSVDYSGFTQGLDPYLAYLVFDYKLRLDPEARNIKK
tara:strand:+ start:5480 stop:6640 length:1161 start_codon:yes stop_codon:yes gene_type:complete